MGANSSAARTCEAARRSAARNRKVRVMCISSGAAIVARAQDRREHLEDLFLVGRRGRQLGALEGGDLGARVGELLVEVLDLLAVRGHFLLRAAVAGDLAVELRL